MPNETAYCGNHVPGVSESVPTIMRYIIMIFTCHLNGIETTHYLVNVREVDND